MQLKAYNIFFSPNPPQLFSPLHNGQYKHLKEDPFQWGNAYKWLVYILSMVEDRRQ